MSGAAAAVPRNRPKQRDGGDAAAVRTAKDRRPILSELQREAPFVEQSVMAPAELDREFPSHLDQGVDRRDLGRGRTRRFRGTAVGSRIVVPVALLANGVPSRLEGPQEERALLRREMTAEREPASARATRKCSRADRCDSAHLHASHSPQQ